MDVGRDSSRRLGSAYSFSYRPALDDTPIAGCRTRWRPKSLFVYGLDLLIGHFFELLAYEPGTDSSENSQEFFKANLRLPQNALQSFWREGAMRRHGHTKQTSNKADM
jgi:hypothetical protein